MKKLLLSGAAASSIGLAAITPLHASTLTVSYYTIAEGDKDANHLAGGTFDNEVMNTLGPDGLPVLNPAANGGVGLPTDLTAGGEITYWSPALNNGGAGGASDVTFTGSTTATLPFNVSQNFFPPNGSGPSDYAGFQAATLTGTLTAPTTEQISFSIGADDMAFAYLDGQVVCDLGGVHPSTAGTCVSPFDITAGPHSLEVFFVDINNSQSGLTFGVDTQGVTTAPPPTSVPAPGASAAFGVALAGIALARRRRAG